jgi:hypothetical protein
MTGTLRLQRHTALVILQQFEDSESDEVVCNLAGWENYDPEGGYLTVEISPKYEARADRNENRLGFIFRRHGDKN